MLGRRDMPGAEWFPGMRMNFAGNLLRHGCGPLADHDAVVCHGEAGKAVRYSFARLFRDVGALEAWLRARGVQCGDRVAGVVTHGYEALAGHAGGHQHGRGVELGVAGLRRRCHY
ncbi:hypothetical protein MBH78_14530 [Oceanimonas sp. NS1]|nr:hypothetical protein [Oceanimonas sp. NS1]